MSVSLEAENAEPAGLRVEGEHELPSELSLSGMGEFIAYVLRTYGWPCLIIGCIFYYLWPRLRPQPTYVDATGRTVESARERQQNALRRATEEKLEEKARQKAEKVLQSMPPPPVRMFCAPVLLTQRL